MVNSRSIKAEPHIEKSNLADVILGGQDGLVNVLGLVLGLVAASDSSKIIIAGGLAATFAESISMAAVAYTSKKAERDHYLAEVEREKAEIEEIPEDETEEIRQIYADKGFKGKLLEEIVTHVVSNKELWLSTMMSDELHLSPVTQSEITTGSFVVGLSTLVGSLIPITSFFWLGIKPALIISLIVSAIVLAFVGVYKARTTVGRPVKSALEMVIIGMGAAFAGYVIGLLFR